MDNMHQSTLSMVRNRITSISSLTFFEEQILKPQEKDFNLTIIYGKDAEWADVVNACRRFPMFAERQVVILKDAAQMKDLSELSGYVEHPSPSTVFLIEHRNKKLGWSWQAA